jgi:hypothetical protein
VSLRAPWGVCMVKNWNLGCDCIVLFIERWVAHKHVLRITYVLSGAELLKVIGSSE